MGNLGFYSTGLMFATFGIFSLGSASMIDYFGHRWSLVIGCCTYFLYVGAQLFALLRQKYDLFPDSDWVIYVLLLTTAFINGWGSSLFWPGGSTYVNECANDSNKGLYNSIFYVMNMGSLVTGNLMAAYLIPDTSESFCYIIFESIVFICIFYFMFI
jgi:MFS family permease